MKTGECIHSYTDDMHFPARYFFIKTTHSTNEIQKAANKCNNEIYKFL